MAFPSDFATQNNRPQPLCSPQRDAVEAQQGRHVSDERQQPGGCGMQQAHQPQAAANEQECGCRGEHMCLGQASMPSKRDRWQQPDVCCAVLHPLACSTPRAAPPGWAPPPPPATGGPCPARPPRAARCAPPCPANGQTGGGCRVVTLQLASRYAMAHRQISTTTHAEN